MTQLSMYEMENGSYKWEVKAAEAIIRGTDERALLTKPVMKFYKDGKVISVVKSQKGMLFPETKDIDLKDDVFVETISDGSVLRGKTLHFSSSQNKIWSKDPVILDRSGTKINGAGFTAKPDLSEIIIEKQETVFSGKS